MIEIKAPDKDCHDGISGTRLLGSVVKIFGSKANACDSRV